jgi:hypothetical protein
VLSIEKLKKLHDKAYEHGKIVRERASDDLVFYWVTQWDDTLLGESSLGYKGEFNVVRKAGRQIIGDLRANPIQVDFEPEAETSDDDSELLDGIYRSVDRQNTSIEAYDNANQECVVCGVADWELYTEYETNSVGDENQVIKRRPVYEGNNTSFCDPSAKLIDKSDADYWSMLVPYSKDGMEKLAKELTGSCESGDTAVFKDPEHSYSFPWVSGKDEIYYAVRFYHREKVNDKVLTLADPFGQEMKVLESALSEIMDELIDEGYEIVGEKAIKRFKVTLYIANGNRVLKTYKIAGEEIPVVRQYGERAYIEGVEHYEGVTRLAKDPQRLRNFQMSYLADIVSRSPRPKPIFFPEQLGQFRGMYEDNGADNNYPYLLQERKAEDGSDLPIGAVAQMPEQNVPTALVESINLSREAVGDVAPANVSQDIADVDLSGKAVAQLQARLDEQSIVYQQNRKFALRRDGQIFASMAKEVYDAPRQVMVTAPDGTRKTVQLMESVVDRDTGELVVMNDLTGAAFEVYSDISQSYNTKKEQTFDQLGEMAVNTATLDPNLARMFILKQTQLIGGVRMEDVRDYARKMEILGGYRDADPENEEEMQWVQEAQQSQQPDANMVLAQAENKKGDALIMREQTNQFKAANAAQTDQAKVEVSRFDAQTKRMAVQVDAEEANANINFKRIDAMTKRIGEMNKSDRFRVSLATA